MKQNTEKSLTCCDCIHDSMCHLTHTKDYPICCEFVHMNQHGAWIKVEEQTPPNREDILVWAFFRDRWNVFVGWYSDVSGIWRIATECGSVREVEVSHWMPLPMDPSEVES